MANVPISNMTATWTDSGTTYTGIKMNVTDTASAAGSLLMDLQVGGSSKVKVAKDGAVTGLSLIDSGSSTTLFGFGQSASIVARGAWVRAEGTYALGIYAASVRLKSDQAFGFSSGAIDTMLDVSLYRDAANTLAQRNGTNAQTLRVYKSYTDASNYSRLAINNNQIASEAAGTGTLEVTADAPVLNLAQTWNNAAVTFTGLKFNATDTASAAASLLMDLQVGGSSKLSIDKSSYILFNGSTYKIGAAANIFDISGFAATKCGEIRIGPASINFGATNSGGDRDVYIQRDAANALAQRNATNAQTLRVYGTYTSSTSYERVDLKSSSSVFYLQPEKGSGGGTLRPLVVGHGATTYSQLPAAAAALEGARAYVSDWTGAATFGTIVNAGGGSTKVPVWCDGTNWLVG